MHDNQAEHDPLRELEMLRQRVAELEEAVARHNGLEESEARYRSIFLNSIDGIFLTDPNGACVAANPAVCQMLQRTEQEIKQLGGRIVVVDLPDPVFEAALRERARTGTVKTNARYVRRDGTRIPVEISSALFKDADGRDWAVIIARDVTARKHMEEQLLRAQRLETAGRLAGQVAHDFNNLLGPLALYPDLIKLQLPPDHPAVAYCDTMLETVQQMADINSDMLALARRGHVNREQVDVNRLVKQVAGQVSPPDALTFEVHPGPALAAVLGTPAQIMRVIANLISNAREAMEDRGSLRLATDNVYLDVPPAAHSQAAVGHYVRITVSDTGPGIPPDIQEKMFEPFFTTKSVGVRRGSGLGLSIVQAIVEDHQGFVEVDTGENRGTTFSVYLPASGELLEMHEDRPLSRGTETILVVDDDPMQRSVLTEGLVSLGYRVHTAPSGEEALNSLREASIDLLILDMVMPGGMDGTDTLKAARLIHPEQRAVIVSGFAETERVQQAQELGAGPYLRKPLSLARLAWAVRAELDR